jgi:hypothetical protein
MCLSLDATLGYIIGIATIANALFNAYVVKTHPSFKSGVLKRTGDPAAGYTSGAEEATAYIKSHPELEARATSAIVGSALAVARASKQQVCSPKVHSHSHSPVIPNHPPSHAYLHMCCQEYELPCMGMRVLCSWCLSHRQRHSLKGATCRGLSRSTTCEPCEGYFLQAASAPSILACPPLSSVY